MKKLLIATAALAMVAGTAQAQSSVQVYGILDLGYSDQKWTDSTDSVTDKFKQASGKSGLSSSRLGFKGTEDLGGGLKAGFTYELGVSTDASTAAHSVRAANVDLSGGFGSLTIGRQNSVGKNMNDNFTAFGGGATFVNGSVVHNVTGNGGTGSLTNELKLGAETKPLVDRISNGVTYSTPTMNGLKASIQLNAKSSDASDVNGKIDTSAIAYRVDYATGNLTAAVAYTDATAKTEAIAGVDGVLGAGSTAAKAYVKAAAAKKTDSDLTQFGLTYNFGVAKVFAAYSDGESKVEGATTKTEVNGMDVGVVVPVSSKVNLLASYGTGDVKYDVSGKTDVDGYMLQAHYSLSKRTTAYAMYAVTKLDNKDTAASASEKGKDSVSMIGLRHSF